MPGLRSLHQALMLDELVRRFGSAVLLYVLGAGNQLCRDRRDPPGDQVGGSEVAHPNGTVKSLSDDVDEAVAVAALHLEARMLACELRKYRREMRGAE